MEGLFNVLVFTVFKAHAGSTFEAMESRLWIANTADSAVFAVVDFLVRSVFVEFADMAEVASEGDLAFHADLGNRLERVALHAEDLFGCVTVNRVARDFFVVADTACIELIAAGSQEFALSWIVRATKHSFLVVCYSSIQFEFYRLRQGGRSRCHRWQAV